MAKLSFCMKAGGSHVNGHSPVCLKQLYAEKSNVCRFLHYIWRHMELKMRTIHRGSVISDSFFADIIWCQLPWQNCAL